MNNSEEQEFNRKRKSNNSSSNNNNNPEDDADFLSLSLSYRPMKPRHSPPAEQPLPPPVPLQQKLSPTIPPHPRFSMQTLLSQPPPQMALQFPPTHSLYAPAFVPERPPPSANQLAYNQNQEANQEAAVPSRPVQRSRRNPTQGPRDRKSDTIPPPFPWATNRRATVHTLEYLLQRQIITVTGEVQCKRCERKFEIGFDLREKFAEVWNFIAERKSTMHDRAPNEWMVPRLPDCRHCGEQNSAKPVIAEKKKKTINWLFLLLGQMLGCCTLEQLKYFCKHTQNHRTGAKNRVLYLTYLGLCKQLDPTGPFDR